LQDRATKNLMMVSPELVYVVSVFDM